METKEAAYRDTFYNFPTESWQVTTRELSPEVLMDLEFMLETDYMGTAVAKMLALREGVVSLCRNGKMESIRKSKGNMVIPTVKDAEGGDMSLLTGLLMCVVDHNRRLVAEDPFKEVFAPYLT